MTGDVCCADCLHSIHAWSKKDGTLWSGPVLGGAEGYWCDRIDVTRNSVTGKRGNHPCSEFNADGKCAYYEPDEWTSTSIWYKPWTWGTGYWGNPPEAPVESLRVPDGVDADGQPYYVPEENK